MADVRGPVADDCQRGSFAVRGVAGEAAVEIQHMNEFWARTWRRSVRLPFNSRLQRIASRVLRPRDRGR